MQSLAARHAQYARDYDYTIMRQVPVIFDINGSNFVKVTKGYDKPFDPEFSSDMTEVLLGLCEEIDGAVFGYQFSDKVVVVARNDQNHNTTPWMGNHVQKMASVSASIATSILGRGYFESFVHGVPNISETVNNLISRQQECIRYSVASAAYIEMGRRLGRDETNELLHGKNLVERKQLLLEACGIEFDTFYDSEFRLGIAAFKAPKVVEGKSKHRWVISKRLPLFSEDRPFVQSIITNGTDIFRAERDVADVVSG